MAFEVIPRNYDVITGSQDLEPLYTFQNFPVFMGCTDAPSEQDLYADMAFSISRSSGMIQLNSLLPLDVLYPEAHGSGSVGASWRSHHQALARFIAKYHPQSVLEIGGGHGVLAAEYAKISPISWTILEPNPTVAPSGHIRVQQGFFDQDFRFPEPVDAIVHSHVFEHLYDPSRFVRHMADFLQPGGKLIFSVPNMRVMLERKYTNCLNFEHTVYMSDDYVDYVLSHNGFRVVERIYHLDDHSVFYSAVRDDVVTPVMLAPDLCARNKALYEAYISYHRKLVAEMNARLTDCRPGQLFLFGAHVQSQYLIGFGLNVSAVTNILDNDHSKHGKRLYGADKIVASPAILAEVDAPVVIMRAGTFTHEISTQIRRINPDVRFLS